jgi:hypothetical protein
MPCAEPPCNHYTAAEDSFPDYAYVSKFDLAEGLYVVPASTKVEERLLFRHRPLDKIQGDAPESQSLESRFYRFANKWMHSMGGRSSTTSVLSDLNYLRIIALGKDAIPFILKELKKEPAPWFLALKVLTGEESVGNSSPGDYRKMASEWIEWGDANGYK